MLSHGDSMSVIWGPAFVPELPQRLSRRGGCVLIGFFAGEGGDCNYEASLKLQVRFTDRWQCPMLIGLSMRLGHRSGVFYQPLPSSWVTLFLEIGELPE